MSDIYAHPVALELFGDDGGAATAEGIEDHVSGKEGGLDDSLPRRTYGFCVG